MATYPELLAQIEDLQRQAEKIRQEEFAAVVATIRQQIANYGITAADLGLEPAAGATSLRSRAAIRRNLSQKGSDKVAAKYRDTSGNTWSGRGKQPRWLMEAVSSGRSISEFLI